MAVAINNSSRPETDFDRIVKGLSAARDVFQIPVDIASISHTLKQQTLTDQQIANEQQKIQQSKAETSSIEQKTAQASTSFGQSQANLAALQKPDSQESVLAKQAAASVTNALMNSQAVQKNPQYASSLKDLIATIQDPNTTGYQVQNQIDQNPMMKELGSMTSKSDALNYLASTQDIRNQRSEERIQNQSNKQYSSEMKPFENTIQSANRALHIINEIQSANPNDPNSLKSTKILMTDLSGAMGSMFTNGKSPTVYSMVGSNQDTWFGKLNQSLTTVTGNPYDTQTPALLNQMKLDIGALKNTYADAHANAYNSFRAGQTPQVVPSLDQRYNIFRSSTGLPPDPNLSGGGSSYQPQAMASSSNSLNPNSPRPGSGPFDSVMSSGNATMRVPKPGDIEQGHRFKGGKPGDPNSWEKVQ